MRKEAFLNDCMEKLVFAGYSRRYKFVLLLLFRVIFALSRDTTGVDLVWQEASIQLCACRRCLRSYHAAKGRLHSRLSLDDSEERYDVSGMFVRQCQLA